MLKPPHELKPDHVRVEHLARVQVVDAQGYLAESSHGCRHYRFLSRPRLEGSESEYSVRLPGRSIRR